MQAKSRAHPAAPHYFPGIAVVSTAPVGVPPPARLGTEGNEANKEVKRVGKVFAEMRHSSL
jgi:hypothetical protein